MTPPLCFSIRNNLAKEELAERCLADTIFIELNMPPLQPPRHWTGAKDGSIALVRSLAAKANVSV